MPSASQSSQQSFTMSQQSHQGHSSSYPRSFHGNPESPQIYSASYSNVDVYEMESNGVAVMRRRKDSYLNSTQILKVAGVEKGKRTKILEKEIQTGTHEKVQGGYGKYQGTWIPFDRGVELCRQYGVEALLRPLLTYDMGQGGGAAGRGDLNTPTKEQAMAAQRKKLYNSSNNAEARPNSLSGTFFQNISSTAQHAVAAISKARFDSPGPKNRNGPSRAPSFSRQPSMQNNDDFPGNSQQSYASDYGQAAESSYPSQPQPSSQGAAPVHGLESEHPRKRQRTTMGDSFGGASYDHNMELYASEFPGSPTEPNESFVYTQSAMNDRSPAEEALPPLPFEMSPDVEQKRALLMSLFMDEAASESPKTDIIGTFSPMELDMPIDNQSHTALHWAATLARMPLLKALIAAGASPSRVNMSGETALMRACLVTNSMELSSFPDLLELLGRTMEARDQKHRTVLHHIAVTSAVKGRSAASRYYLESLLEWVVRQGSVPSSQSVPASQPNTQAFAPKMGIARFMSEIVNSQDSAGDTALNIAARIGNRSIVSQLLEVGADPGIANRAGLRPLDFGIGTSNVEQRADGEVAVETNGPAASSQPARESVDDIIGSITHLLGETGSMFRQEIQKKQSSIDTLHASLRTSSTNLSEARRKHDQLTAKLKKQQLARQIISNLSHARQDDQLRHLQEQGESSPPSWETELSTILESSSESSGGFLPSSLVLKTRIQALQRRAEATRNMVQGLKGRSRDVEIKYRRVVSLCTGVAESEVDANLDGLLKAVESEREELDIGRVRRFLGGVEGVH